MSSYNHIAIAFHKKKPENLVQEIAGIKFPAYRRSVGFVFSSKYCHFHYPDKFPIYDRFARIALSDLIGNKKKKIYLNNYFQFKKDLDELISKLDWKSSYKEMDKYLWLYGQWLYYKEKESQNRQVFSRRIRNLILKHKKLFSDLEPL